MRAPAAPNLLCLLGLGLGPGLWAGCAPAPGPNSVAPAAAEATPTPVVSGTAAARINPRPPRTDRLALTVEGMDPAEWAADRGLELLTVAPLSGFVTVAVPDGWDVGALLSRLQDDPNVGCTLQEAWAYAGSAGAAVDGEDSAGHDDPALRWQLDVAEVPAWVDPGGPRVVVAVIDSGLVGQEDGGATWAPPAFGGVSVHSPRDFVNGDPWPQDDQRHGSHMASLIAAQGPSGGAAGVAPGVELMPLKVLDHENVGTELDVVEAIYWATVRGADVINLSLSFWPDYLPSEALLGALDFAADNGVVLVGAAGNLGLAELSWPAASPEVIAVGSGCLRADGGLELAPYSNRGLGVDLIAPGGCLDRDVDGDGRVDGLVGEAPVISVNGLPVHGESELVLWSGTSQAAALVSGAAARLLAAGAEPEAVRALLRAGLAADLLDGDADAHLLAGAGGGRLRLGAALEAAGLGASAGNGVLGALLPVLQVDTGGQTTATVYGSAVDRLSGAPLTGVELWIRAVDGAGASVALRCTTDRSGGCAVGVEALGGGAAESWTFELQAVTHRDGVVSRPAAALFGHDGLAVLSAATAAEGLRGEVLALAWEAGVDEVYGEVAAAWSFIDLAAGADRLPRAVLATQAAVEALGEIEAAALPASRGGAQSDLIEVDLLRIDGSGLSASPIGYSTLPVVGLRVRELPGGPVAAHPADLHTAGGSGLSTSPLGYAPVDLGRAVPVGDGLMDVGLSERIAAGGWRARGGQGAGDLLPALGLPRAEAPALAGSSADGAMAFSEERGW
ncbi:MAG: S8 family serine peptidase [Deltaproteobacteria bacterium]|nr:S8 family serine peptidase [Deltaproteobacteria bacterium]